MATAVLDLDADNLPAKIDGLSAYDKALILFRYRSRPIARSEIKVRDGAISVEALVEALGDGRNMLDRERLRDMLGWSDRVPPVPLPSATVAVCTRDRPEDLRRCLDGIVRLLDDGQEVLIVDNCPSTEASKDVVADFPTVRYVREPRPGLNHARNCALRNATGEIVAFIDDDATPDPMWLRALLGAYTDPNIMCVTGLTMPLELETSAQEQFESYSTFDRGFERKIYSAGAHNPLAVGGIGSGANMSVRRSIFEHVGGFDNALDAGTATQSGGDHEMFVRILTSGYRIVYEPWALNWHRHRRTDAELKKTIYGYGVGVYSAFLRSLLWDREVGGLLQAWYWFRYDQAPNLVRAILGRKRAPRLDLVLSELRGCLNAPMAYWRSTRRLKQSGGPRNE